MMHLAVAVNDRDSSLITILVSLFTWAKAYHCELIFSDGVTITADPKGVRFLDDETYDHYKWVMLPLPQIDTDNEAKIRERAAVLVDRKCGYDYLGAILGRFSATLENSDKWYCSELCRYLLKDDITCLSDNKWITPDRIWKAVATDLDQRYQYYDKPSNYHHLQ